MIAKPEHEVAFQTLTALLREMADKHGLSSLEMLAIAANMIGKLIALQDQRTVSPAKAMEVVAVNIQFGNQQAIDQLANPQGTS